MNKNDFTEYLAKLQDYYEKEFFCLKAVNKNISAIEYVPKTLKIAEFFIEAAKKNVYVLNFVPKTIREDVLIMYFISKTINLE